MRIRMYQTAFLIHLAEYTTKNSCSRFKVASSLCDPDLLGFGNLVGLTEHLTIIMMIRNLKHRDCFLSCT